MSREGIMLCYPFDIKRFEKWGSKAIIQPKLNGSRCRCIVGPGKVTLYSSEGNEITSVPHINQAMLPYPFAEYDGELYRHGMPLQQLRSIVGRTVNLHPDYKLIEYHIFDIIENAPQHSRMNAINIFNPIDSIRMVRGWEVISEDDIMQAYDKFINEGYEGFILRNEDALYERKRSTNIMKYKPRKSDCYQIIGYVEEQSIHGELKDALGALILEKDNQNFNVGTGFTRKQRLQLWKEKEMLVGKWCTIKYQYLTEERQVPYAPVFVVIKDVEEEDD